MVETKCVVKIGNYDGDLSQLVSGISSDYIPIPIGRAEVCKQGLIYPTPEGNSIIMLSQQRNFPNEPFNVMVSIMGPQLERAQQLMGSLEKELGFQLRDSPVHERLFATLAKRVR